MDSLKQAKKEHLAKIKEAAVVRRDANNKLHIKERGDISTGRGAAGGATVGAIVGLFGGPIGAVVGGAVGAAIGGLASKLIDTGIRDDKLRQLGESLTPGSSALVALVEPTGVMSTQTGGRPAALFRFRREVLQERPAPGLGVRARR